jgi:hypothetical protein
LKAAVSKTAILSNRDRGFESHPLRQLEEAKIGSPADFKGYFDGYPIRIPKMNIMAVEYAACNLIWIILR